MRKVIQKPVRTHNPQVSEYHFTAIYPYTFQAFFEPALSYPFLPSFLYHQSSLIKNRKNAHELTIGPGFFLCATEKNSLAPKLKKMETQDKNSNSRQNIYFPAFWGAIRKENYQKICIILPQMYWNLSVSGRKIANFLKKSII